MTPVRRFFLPIALVALAVATASPALAVEEPEGTTEETTETTLAIGESGEEQDQDQAATGNVPAPAVTVPDTAAEEQPVDWTYRYLIPTLLVLALIVVIITTVQYFVRVVRSRYKVVE